MHSLINKERKLQEWFLRFSKLVVLLSCWVFTVFQMTEVSELDR